MSFTLSVPGKTFLCGEYIALHGGPCILLATEPRFRLKVSPGKGKSPFHPDSPAGRIYARHANELSDWQFDFQNPYGGGGFGGSTAEFLLLKAFIDLRDTLQTEAQLDLDLRATLSEFRELHSGQDTPPSGADLVGQACGQVTAFERLSGRIQVFSWPFPHLSWALFSTGRKLPSHEHLKTLSLPSTDVLVPAVHQIWEALKLVSEGAFIIGLNDFSRGLASLGLQAPETLQLTQTIKNWPGVRATKGCGAMGADVVFVLYDTRETTRADVLAQAQKLGLQFQADESQLNPGLRKDFQGPAFSVVGVR